MSSEDIDSSTHPETNSRGEDEPQPVLRVRVISEINSTEIADGAGSSPLKRRSIESPSETDDTTKKQKLETNSDQGAAPPSSMDAALPSTSSSNSNNQDGGKSAIAGSSSEPNGEHVNVVVKEEPADETPSGSNDPPTATAQLLPVKKEESSVKEEPTSSIRDSCQFGIRCYRDEDKNSPEPSKRSWTTRDVKRMLKMVKERPVLWQVEHSDYKHRNNRPLALLEIEKVIGFTSLEIKRKLHNMRCTFRNQFKLKNTQNPNRTITWKYYNAMKFMYASALSSNVGNDGDNVSWTEPDEEEIVFDAKIPSVLLSPSTRLPAIESQIPIKMPSSLSPKSSSSLPLKNKTRNEEKSLLEVAVEKGKDDDSNEFGDYVADSIRNLPTDLKDLAKKQISHLLVDMIAHANERELNANFDDLESNVLCPATATPVFGVCQRTSPIETQEFQLKLHEF